MASVVLLGMILTGFLVSYQRMTERIVRESIRARALAIAQEKIELLLAANQEPDPAEMQGQDEEEPLFTWKMELKRVPIGEEAPKPDLSNTLIEAKVIVEYDDGEEGWTSEDIAAAEPDEEEAAEWDEEEYTRWRSGTEKVPAVELIRYIAALKPLSEGSLAVTQGPQEAEDPEWLKELRKTLGREPTFDEILQKMFETEGSPADMAEMLNLPQESAEPAPGNK